GFRADQEIETRKCPTESRAGHLARIEYAAIPHRRLHARRLSRYVGNRAPRTVLLALEEELHAVSKIVVERDLGDCRVDRDLELWTIELRQRPRDDLVIFRAGIDQQRVARDIGRDPH